MMVIAWRLLLGVVRWHWPTYATIFVNDVEPIIFDNEIIAKSKNLVDDVITSEKPLVVEKKDKAKKGKKNKVSQVLNRIPQPLSFVPQRIKLRFKRKSITRSSQRWKNCRWLSL